MGIEIKTNGFYDNDYDGCGNLTVASLYINGVSIPMCQDCIDELISELETFNNTVFCKDCRYFVKNKYGYAYSGACKKRAEEAGEEVKESDVGYSFITDFMCTCKCAMRGTDA